MQMKELYGIRSVGDVGLEIECEGTNLPMRISDKRWKTVADGSLRDGLEYVFNGAQPIHMVDDLIDSLHKTFRETGTKLDFSFRTSVHVHLNMLDFTFPQILNCIYTYLLFEPALIHYSGEGRKANRFCLSVPDAEGAINQLQMLFSYPYVKGKDFPPAIEVIDENAIRYAAINIGSLRKHGTVEIRCMRGTDDKKTLLNWINLLWQMRSWAIKWESPKEIYEYIRANGILSTFKEVSGELYDEFYYPEMEGEFNMNLSLTIELPHCISFLDADKDNKPKKAPGREIWEDFEPAPARPFIIEDDLEGM